MRVSVSGIPDKATRDRIERAAGSRASSAGCAVDLRVAKVGPCDLEWDELGAEGLAAVRALSLACGARVRTS